MKPRAVNFLIALAVSLLIAYGIWSIDGMLKNYLVVGSFVFLAGTLVPAIGIEYEYGRRAANLTVLSWCFFIIGLIANLICSFINISSTAYIIVSGISFLLFIYIANSIYSTPQ